MFVCPCVVTSVLFYFVIHLLPFVIFGLVNRTINICKLINLYKQPINFIKDEKQHHHFNSIFTNQHNNQTEN